MPQPAHSFKQYLEHPYSARSTELEAGRCPGMLINMSTGVMGDDIQAQLDCLTAVQPEMAGTCTDWFRMHARHARHALTEWAARIN